MKKFAVQRLLVLLTILKQVYISCRNGSNGGGAVAWRRGSGGAEWRRRQQQRNGLNEGHELSPTMSIPRRATAAHRARLRTGKHEWESGRCGASPQEAVSWHHSS